jgi:lia operon protein LiaG
MNRMMRWRTAVGSSLLALALGAGRARGQEAQRLTGDRVAIYNLAGRLEVVAGSGPDVVVRVTRGGADAAKLKLESSPIGGRSTLRVIYPSREIVYSDRAAGAGRNGLRDRFSSDVRVRADGTFDGDNGRGGDRVTIRGSGPGLEAWADLRVEVPAGRTVEVREAVGDADVRSVEAKLKVVVGSGTVTAATVHGSLDLDTGSGSVTVSDVEGEVGVNTGSGGVDVQRVRGSAVSVNTGSGSVRGGEITSPSLNVVTGSGSIRLTRVSSGRVSLETGSGSVDVELMAKLDELSVDTGSGSVTLYLPPDLSADVSADTGSGGIDLEIPVQIRSVKRDHLEGRIGDGRGRITIQTGSGGIRLLGRR